MIVGAIVVLVGVAALVAWPLGGWQTVSLSRDRVEQVAAGEPFDAAPYRVEVHAVTISPVGPSGYGEPSNAGDVFLTVEATLESSWNRPLDLYTFDDSLVRFDRLDELDDYDDIPEIRRADDLTGGVQTGPGVGVPVLFTWEVPGEWYGEGDEIVVTVTAHRSRTSSLDAATTVWDSAGAVAAVPCVTRVVETREDDS